MLNNAQKKEKYVKEDNFEEKLTADFSPYQTASEILQLEQYLFEEKAFSDVYMVGFLRDRYCLLQTTSAILRGESLYRADLSDLCDMIFKPSNTSEEMLISIMQILHGKKNRLKVLYRRCVEHKDVNLCPIAALFFYLFTQFNCSGEGEQFDFLDNYKWFNVKLLVDCRGKVKTISESVIRLTSRR